MAATEVPLIDPTFEDTSEEESNYASDLESQTTSLASRATDYKFVHGRRYHSYGEEGRYVFPNDDKESDRLDMMHEMTRLIFHGKNFNAPVTDPKRILDVGTGTGIWAIEVADQFPQADVMGNDLSPIQPRWVPPNLHFEIDDVEKPWTYSTLFDFIHVRTLHGAIRDWAQLAKQCFEHTAPGGYVEFIDYDSVLRSPDNSLPENSSLRMLNRILCDHLEKAGTTVSPGPHLEGWVKSAGYEIVSHSVNPVPYGMWPKDQRLKEIGAWMYMQTVDNIEAMSLYILHVKEGWSKEEVDVICAKVRAELKDKRQHTMMNLHAVVGRKPM